MNGEGRPRKEAAPHDTDSNDEASASVTLGDVVLVVPRQPEWAAETLLDHFGSRVRLAQWLSAVQKAADR